MARIDEMQGTGKVALAQVAQHDAAERTLARTGADNGD
jgi:hypothetical protein